MPSEQLYIENVVRKMCLWQLAGHKICSTKWLRPYLILNAILLLTYCQWSWLFCYICIKPWIVCKTHTRVFWRQLACYNWDGTELSVCIWSHLWFIRRIQCLYQYLSVPVSMTDCTPTWGVGMLAHEDPRWGASLPDLSPFGHKM